MNVLLAEGEQKLPKLSAILLHERVPSHLQQQKQAELECTILDHGIMDYQTLNHGITGSHVAKIAAQMVVARVKA